MSIRMDQIQPTIDREYDYFMSEHPHWSLTKGDQDLELVDKVIGDDDAVDSLYHQMRDDLTQTMRREPERSYLALNVLFAAKGSATPLMLTLCATPGTDICTTTSVGISVPSLARCLTENRSIAIASAAMSAARSDSNRPWLSAPSSDVSSTSRPATSCDSCCRRQSSKPPCLQAVRLGSLPSS